jgi:hypothetical protein
MQVHLRVNFFHHFHFSVVNYQSAETLTILSHGHIIQTGNLLQVTALCLTLVLLLTLLIALSHWISFHPGLVKVKMPVHWPF